VVVSGQVVYVRVRWKADDRYGGSVFGDTVQVEPVNDKGESDGSTVWVDPKSVMTSGEIVRKIRGER